jgi:hypothetical protein
MRGFYSETSIHHFVGGPEKEQCMGGLYKIKFVPEPQELNDGPEKVIPGTIV